MLLLVGCGAPTASPEPPRPTPARSGTLTRLTQRYWQGAAIPWQAALIEVLTTDRLSPPERERLLDELRLLVFAREKYNFRVGRLDKVLGDRFRRAARGPGDMDEDVLLAGLPAVIARWERLAPGPGPLLPYPPELVLPHDELGTEHHRPWDPRPGQDPGPAELLHILERLEPTPREAAALLPDLREIERQVRDVRQAWLGLTALGTTRARVEQVQRKARELPDNGLTASAAFDLAMGYIFQRWDEAPERLREHLP